MRKEANMLDVNIWTEEPEEAGKVLYFQDKTQYVVLALVSCPHTHTHTHPLSALPYAPLGRACAPAR